jgi:uncharacterized membrane protein
MKKVLRKFYQIIVLIFAIPGAIILILGSMYGWAKVWFTMGVENAEFELDGIRLYFRQRNLAKKLDVRPEENKN